MESQKVSAKIPCPLHPTEFIQRVHTDVNARQQLFCLECILQHEDSTSISAQLKTIPNLIDTAADFYAKNKQALNLGSQVPPEYVDLVSQQGEKLEKLSKHIEEEKKKVSNIFDNILQDTVKMISEKKNEYLHSLDQQLFNLRYWYIFFDKQLKKAYPSEEDIPFLYPTKEDLNTKLGKITNATQLMAFVRNLKEDLNEHKMKGQASDVNLERGRQTYISSLSKELIKVENIKPYYKQGELEMSSFKQELQEKVSDLLNELISLESPIKDVIGGSNFESKFVSAEEFELIKGWLPKNIGSFHPKLLYSAKRDGVDANTFHKRCDGKKNTITIIKAQFSGSTKTCTIGGYLDTAWTSNSNYIKSKQSFIFSTTSKVKCPVTNQQYGGYGAPGQGPTFGGGHDIVVSLAGSGQNYVNPNSYSGTAQIIEDKTYTNGQLAYFTAKEVEVYSLN